MKMKVRGDADNRDGALARERRCSRPQPGELAGTAARRAARSCIANREKGGDGLERRPPAGIARERETRADDAAPCQRERRTTVFMMGAVCRRTDHGGLSRWEEAPG